MHLGKNTPNCFNYHTLYYFRDLNYQTWKRGKKFSMNTALFIKNYLKTKV